MTSVLSTMEMHRFKKMKSLGSICYFYVVHALFSHSITRWLCHLTIRKAVNLYLYTQIDFFTACHLVEGKQLWILFNVALEVLLPLLYCFCFGREVFFIWLTIPILLYFVFLSLWSVHVINFTST